MIKIRNKLWAVCVLTIICIVLINPSLAAALPYINSPYYCLVDGKSGQIIVSRQADEMRPVASTTKMMTAILTVEYADTAEIAVVSSNAQRTPEYAIGLREGQELTVAELLKAALICSANDAAVVLSEHIAGEERFFAHLMSKKAFVLGAFNTHFTNASGLPSSDHYSTAYDLTRIGRYLLDNEYLQELVATRQTQFHHPGYRKPMIINNTNSLLGTFRGADGIKTGTTNAAGKCLVASATRDNRQLIAVVLRSGNRSGDCAALLEYGFNSSKLVKVVDKSVPFKQINLLGKNIPYLDLYPKDDIFVWVTENSPDIQKKVEVRYLVSPPLKAGEKLGTLSVYADNQLVQSTDLICREAVKPDGNALRRFLQNLRAN